MRMTGFHVHTSRVRG